MSLPEIAWAGCAGDAIAWNAVRVTCASLDKQPHDVAAMFDQVADRYDHPAFHKVYSEYLMTALPSVARAVSSHPDSCVCLAESIQAWHDEQGLATEIGSGWRLVEWRNLTGGIVALHRAIRPA